MKTTIAQINTKVGDISGNLAKIFAATKQAEKDKSEIIIFPELTISGYPCQDLLLRKAFVEECESAVLEVIKFSKKINTAIIFGSPSFDACPLTGKTNVFNTAYVVHKGKIIHKQHKIDLPNYGVFDERRTFDNSIQLESFNFKNKNIGLLICEDTWNLGNGMFFENLDLLISINSSPFEITKDERRKRVASQFALQQNCTIIYVNQIGGEDEIVFDGGSFVINSKGQVITQAKFFEEEILFLASGFQLPASSKSKQATGSKMQVAEKQIYSALKLSLKDYLEKNNFKGVIIGMSGGIDSALTAAIAVDAIGSDKVKLVMMPSKFTSKESLDDAAKCAKNLGCKLENISIANIIDEFEENLKPHFKGKNRDITEENLQSRTRGVLLMALSNKLSFMVFSTGNKSEMATGYATIYGDMCGGFNVLKDLYKTQVFALAKWRNKQGKVIPDNIIKKPPTAELRENQKDQDSLPEYEILDAILEMLIEKNFSAKDIIKKGFKKDVVERVARLLKNSEYKRNQSCPGTKITTKAFGKDWRYPISNGYSF
jgi:NAD+ synthase